MLDVSSGDATRSIPFDSSRLDRLMEDAGIDVLLVCSKHNVQYLLGGHRSIFFSYMDAMALSRYLPIVVYPKGAADKAAFIGHRLETHQRELQPFWTPHADTTSSGSTDAMQKAIDYVRRSGVKTRRIGIEFPFLPLDAATTLRDAFPESELKNGVSVLDRLRAKKTPHELELLRLASEHVVEAMTTVIANHGPGTTKAELVEALRREETNGGLMFEYCLITMGTGLNRGSSTQKWQAGDILSLDSGANFEGYIGDLCRMAILGEPDAELEDMLAEIEAIQRAAMKPIKAGALGDEIYVRAGELIQKSPNREHLHFLAHGMGLVSHESPRLTRRGPIPPPGYDGDRPLEASMVVSIETTLLHPRRGFIKLEDTVAVTDTGFEIFGEGGRGWNRAGVAGQK